MRRSRSLSFLTTLGAGLLFLTWLVSPGPGFAGGAGEARLWAPSQWWGVYPDSNTHAPGRQPAVTQTVGDFLAAHQEASGRPSQGLFNALDKTVCAVEVHFWTWGPGTSQLSPPDPCPYPD